MYHRFNIKDLIEPVYPLRPIKRMVDETLDCISRTFAAAYSDTNRPGVPLETLLKALLLQAHPPLRSWRPCRGLHEPQGSYTRWAEPSGKARPCLTDRGWPAIA
jgi:hypothetical protein